MTMQGRPRGAERVTTPWDLTERELEILQRVAADTTDDDVASDMFLSAATVRTHMKKIRAKLGVSTRTGAVVKALRAGVIS